MPATSKMHFCSQSGVNIITVTGNHRTEKWERGKSGHGQNQLPPSVHLERIPKTLSLPLAFKTHLFFSAFFVGGWLLGWEGFSTFRHW